MQLCVQAWGVMEGRLGNFAQARSLFTAGLQIDPRNAPCWKSWIQMEQVAELFDRADALRNYRDEAYRKLALPTSFSTLPGAPEQGTVMQTVCPPLLSALALHESTNCWCLDL
jgi:hypothetical protein